MNEHEKLNSNNKNNDNPLYYSHLGMIIGIILFSIFSLINNHKIDIQLLIIFILGELFSEVYKYKKSKSKFNLFISIVCFLLIISGIILYI